MAECLQSAVERYLRNRVGPAKAAVNLLETRHETRDGAGTDWEMNPDPDIPRAEFAWHDPDAFFRRRIFHPQQIVGQQRTKTTQELPGKPVAAGPVMHKFVCLSFRRMVAATAGPVRELCRMHHGQATPFASALSARNVIGYCSNWWQGLGRSNLVKGQPAKVQGIPRTYCVTIGPPFLLGPISDRESKNERAIVCLRTRKPDPEVLLQSGS